MVVAYGMFMEMQHPSQVLINVSLVQLLHVNT